VRYVRYIAKITEHVTATSLATRSEWGLERLFLLVEVVGGRNVLGKYCTEERQCKDEGTSFGSHRLSIIWQFKREDYMPTHESSRITYLIVRNSQSYDEY
jgi:hypothetical protein